MMWKDPGLTPYVFLKRDRKIPLQKLILTISDGNKIRRHEHFNELGCFCGHCLVFAVPVCTMAYFLLPI